MEKATPVLFYRFGEVNESTKCGGFVVQSYNNETLDIMLVSSASGDVCVKKGVPHISDPRLKDNVEFARYQGAWDYHPLFRPKQSKPDKSAEDIEAKIVELSERFSFDEVHKKVRMHGMSKDALQAIYDKNDLVTADA